MMIVKCSKRPDGWIPVIGNEEEICEFLLKQNYYEEYSIDKNGNYFDFEVNNNNIFDGEYFNNHEGFFVKLNDDESITVSEEKPSFEDYVAVEFNLTDDFDWVNWLFNASNVNSLHKNQITNSFIKQWYIKPLPFQMQEGSILIFNENSKTLHNVLNRTSVTIDDTLLENGYAVHGNTINQEIYTLEKRLQKRISLEERMAIVSRIGYLKNMKG